MGVESGGGGGRGTRIPEPKNQQGCPPDFFMSVFFFLDTYNIFTFSNIFQIKWPKSEEKLNFVGK